MDGIYTLRYRWRGRSFHTVVAGADWPAAVAEFRREFPHVQVGVEEAPAVVTGVGRFGEDHALAGAATWGIDAGHGWQ